MTTETAQRRLLEAFAELDRTGCAVSPPQDALAEFAGGLALIRGALAGDQPAVAALFEALEELALAVREDRTSVADEVRLIERA